MKQYPDPKIEPDRVRRLCAPAEIKQVFERVQASINQKYPKSTPEQTAWDTLTRLEENLKGFERAIGELQKAAIAHKRANILLMSFQKARDAILGSLYDSIRERFESLYRQLHEPDEQDFKAKIEPDGAGLNIEVDFHGYGTHPPHALHSEGHQDSMGLCLYLALAERLNQDFINLVILDDVVMSVDADHRRKICHLLATVFPDRQFLITTHDRTWANQLRSEGVVSTRGTVEFYGWNMASGPRVSYEVDMWQRIEQDLKKNNISSAAACLRHGSEQFFEMMSDVLHARVQYKSNGRWELGDFMPASIGQYKTLLKQAKKAANSWNDEETQQKLTELDSIAKAIFTRTQAEQWGVNASVHYNSWANLQRSDFQPIVEAFQDLYGLFTCSQCGGNLYVVTRGVDIEGVRCHCNKVNWNLVAKPKT